MVGIPAAASHGFAFQCRGRTDSWRDFPGNLVLMDGCGVRRDLNKGLTPEVWLIEQADSHILMPVLAATFKV